ncbi:hypothetical protein GW17_00001310 [Ensete ventricosum]|nr:hypothetical protein GW17_00001310 [Ensete ventricosum]
MEGEVLSELPRELPDPLDGNLRGVVEAVQHDDPEAPFEELQRRVAADVPGATGDQNGTRDGRRRRHWIDGTTKGDRGVLEIRGEARGAIGRGEGRRGGGMELGSGSEGSRYICLRVIPNRHGHRAWGCPRTPPGSVNRRKIIPVPISSLSGNSSHFAIIKIWSGARGAMRVAACGLFTACFSPTVGRAGAPLSCPDPDRA